MDADSPSASTSSAPAGAATNPYEAEEQFNFFQRAVLWRIYLRVLPFPFNATSMDNLTEDWCSTLFKQRAWYRSVQQNFLERYPNIANAIVVPNEELGQQQQQQQQQRPNSNATNATRASGAAGGKAHHVDPSASVSSNGDDAGAGRAAESRSSNSASSPTGPSNPSLWRKLARTSTKARPHGASAAATSMGANERSPIGAISDDIIALDIRRSYLVTDPYVPHDQLFRILAVWRYLNPLCGYHQGMHEVAGNCLSLLHRAAAAVPSDAPLAVAECCNPIYAEADAFVLFDTIMIHFGLGELFVPSHILHQHGSIRAAANKAARSAASDVERPEFGDMRDDDPASKLEIVCNFIVEGLLKNHSTTLYHHLANTGTLEQCLLFLPRWVRNLFTREVSVAQAYVLWDAIFAIYYYELMQKVMLQLERKQRRAAVDGADEGGGGGEAGGGGGGGEDTKAKGGGGLIGRIFRRSASGSGLPGNNPSSPQGERGTARGSGTLRPSDDATATTDSAASSTRSAAAGAGDGGDTLMVPSTPLTVLGTSPVGNVRYAGQAQVGGSVSGSAAPAASGGGGGAAAVTGSDGNSEMFIAASTSPSCFSRTVAGIALVLLMYIEDDLLAATDDFSILKCLTRTPLIPSTADPIIIISKAMTLARTRPAGIVPFSMRHSRILDRRLIRGEQADGSSDDDIESTTAASHAARKGPLHAKGKRAPASPAARSRNPSGPALPLLPPRLGGFNSASPAISREELFQQHQSIAVVLQSVRTRLERLIDEGRANASEAAGGGGGGGISGFFKPKGGGAFKKGGSSAVPAPAAVFTLEQLQILESTVAEIGHLSAKLQ